MAFSSLGPAKATMGRSAHVLAERSSCLARRPEAGDSDEGALDDPTSGQQHEAALGFGRLDDVQFYAVCPLSRGWLLMRVALIDDSDRDVVSSESSHGRGQTLDLGAVVGTGQRQIRRQMRPRVIGKVGRVGFANYAYDPSSQPNGRQVQNNLRLISS